MVPTILGNLHKNRTNFGSFQTLDYSNCRSEWAKWFCLFPSQFVELCLFVFFLSSLLHGTFRFVSAELHVLPLFCLLGTRWHCPSHVQNCDRAWSPRVLHQQTTRCTRVLYAFTVHCGQSRGTFLKISIWHGL